MAMKSVQHFFDDIVKEYDDLVVRSLPRYHEAVWAMFYYLPAEFKPKRVLDLGCGTGLISELMHKRFPQAEVVAVDISDEMLKAAGKRLEGAVFTPITSGFESLDLECDSFDLVMSNLAIHHITDAAKRLLIQKIGLWLKPDGIFVYSDQVQNATERLFQADKTHFEAYAKEQGATEEDIQGWVDHREKYDMYAKPQDIARWMEEAGLRETELLWRYCFWAVFQGTKL
jgi:tRNA (cmo5U34)-methyltransferase